MPEDFHNALYDAQVTAEILIKLFGMVNYKV